VHSNLWPTGNEAENYNALTIWEKLSPTHALDPVVRREADAMGEGMKRK
jgi:hypothetical protein